MFDDDTQVRLKSRVFALLKLVADSPPKPSWLDGVKGASLILTLRKVWGAADPTDMGSLVATLMLRRGWPESDADAALETCALAVAHLLPVFTRRALGAINDVVSICCPVGVHDLGDVIAMARNVVV